MSLYPHVSDIDNDSIITVSNQTETKNDTQLTRAVLLGNSQKCLEIIQNDPTQLNAQNSIGWTALMIAAASSKVWGLENMVKLLIDASYSNLNIQNTDGRTALIIAISYLHLNGSSEETVKMLIDAGTSVNIQDLFWQNTALMHAVNFDYNIIHENVLKMLIDANANVNMQDKSGYTALMIILQMVNIPETAVEMLIAAGANLNIQNVNGDTALSFTRNRTNKKIKNIMRTLINAGADPKIKNYQGKDCVDAVNFIFLENTIEKLQMDIEQLKMDNSLLKLRPYPGVDYIREFESEFGVLSFNTENDKTKAMEFAETHMHLLLKAIETNTLKTVQN